MRRNYPTITLCALSVVAIVLLVFAFTGCSGGMAYDTLSVKAADQESPPHCVVVTDDKSGFSPTHRIIGTYCLTPTNSTQVPR